MPRTSLLPSGLRVDVTFPPEPTHQPAPLIPHVSLGLGPPPHPDLTAGSRPRPYRPARVSSGYRRSLPFRWAPPGAAPQLPPAHATPSGSCPPPPAGSRTCKPPDPAGLIPSGFLVSSPVDLALWLFWTTCPFPGNLPPSSALSHCPSRGSEAPSSLAVPTGPTSRPERATFLISGFQWLLVASPTRWLLKFSPGKSKLPVLPVVAELSGVFAQSRFFRN